MSLEGQCFCCGNTKGLKWHFLKCSGEAKKLFRKICPYISLELKFCLSGSWSAYVTIFVAVEVVHETVFGLQKRSKFGYNTLRVSYEIENVENERGYSHSDSTNRSTCLILVESTYNWFLIDMSFNTYRISTFDSSNMEIDISLFLRETSQY